MDNDKISSFSEDMWTRGKSVDKLLNEIKECVDLKNGDYEGLLNRYNKLKDEYNKDEEIKLLKDKYDNIKKNSVYVMTDVECESYNKFRNKHLYKCGNSSKIEIILEYCGIGTSIKLRCPMCKEELDITDIDRW